MVIEEPKYGIFFTNVFGDQAFQRWNDILKVGVESLVSYLVMVVMVKTKENARFSLKLRKLIVGHPDQEKLKSKKVKLESLGYKKNSTSFKCQMEHGMSICPHCLDRNVDCDKAVSAIVLAYLKWD
ncbi:hypothetical protein Tco_1088261 [Tanacetum coccineum]